MHNSNVLFLCNTQKPGAKANFLRNFLQFSSFIYEGYFILRKDGENEECLFRRQFSVTSSKEIKF